MNSRQLRKLGVPEDCLRIAITAIQQASKAEHLKGKAIKQVIEAVLEKPEAYQDDAHFGQLARDIIESRTFVMPPPIDYATWGSEIDDAAHGQMKQACGVPLAVAAALMPDAHVGYGLPIGGVLALENAVIPYAVGVDIACRMKLSVLDMPPASLEKQFELYREALEKGTRFGVGQSYETPQGHDVMDQDWSITRITREKKDLAWKQLGTSGSGNHFVEFGVLQLAASDEALGLEAGQYVALMSHSGSRGTGAAVCSTYSHIARAQLPKRYEDFAYLAWLSLATEEGQDYWAAMNLMGEYAAANHEVIHRLVTKQLGATIIAGVENHHNFAWKEIHAGREMVVHRKGATPAGAGVLGVIPGSMADPAFVVRGKGKMESLASASHGGGSPNVATQGERQVPLEGCQKGLGKEGRKGPFGRRR